MKNVKIGDEDKTKQNMYKIVLYFVYNGMAIAMR